MGRNSDPPPSSSSQSAPGVVTRGQAAKNPEVAPQDQPLPPTRSKPRRLGHRQRKSLVRRLLKGRDSPASQSSGSEFLGFSGFSTLNSPAPDQSFAALSTSDHEEEDTRQLSELDPNSPTDGIVDNILLRQSLNSTFVIDKLPHILSSSDPLKDDNLSFLYNPFSLPESMSDNPSSSTSNAEKSHLFDGRNYIEWAVLMEWKLKLIGAYELATSARLYVRLCDLSEDEKLMPTNIMLLQTNVKACALIMASVTGAVRIRMSNLQTCYEMWNYLADFYNPKVAGVKDAIRVQLNQMRFNMEASLEKYFARFDRLMCEYRAQGADVSEEQELEMLRTTLPFDFHTVREVFTGLPQERQTLHEFKVRCLNFHKLFKLNKTSQDNSNAFGKRGNNNRGNSNGSSGSGNSSNNNYRSGSNGNSNNRGNSTNSGNGNNNNNSNGRSFKCYNCGNAGHYARNCRNQSGNGHNANNNNNRNNNNNSNNGRSNNRNSNNNNFKRGNNNGSNNNNNNSNKNSVNYSNSSNTPNESTVPIPLPRTAANMPSGNLGASIRMDPGFLPASLSGTAFMCREGDV